MFHLKHVNTMGEKLKDPGIGINIIQTHSTGSTSRSKTKTYVPFKAILETEVEGATSNLQGFTTY